MSVERPHALIAVTGAIDNDDPEALESQWRLARPFRRRGFDVSVHDVGWHDAIPVLDDKLSAICDVIERKLVAGETVSLAGISAGGDLSLAAFMEFPRYLNGVVAYGTRVNKHTDAGYPSLDELAVSLPLMVDTIDWLMDHEADLTPEMRDRVMTRRSRAGDDLFPHIAHVLKGAHNVVEPFSSAGLCTCC
jgi:hypothetical protein